MEIKIEFLIWCDHDITDSIEMHEVKRDKFQVTFECPVCKKQITINEISVLDFTA